MPAKTNLNKPWSPGDMKKLRPLAKARVSARVAAQKLGRSRGSVAFKAMNEGIRFQSIAQPAGVQQRRFQKRRRR